MEGKTRLTKVVLNSVKGKREVLGSAKKLEESDTWSNIFITPDMSPKEREKSKKLLEELKRRRDEGEAGVVIRGDDCIPRSTSASSSGA